MTILSKACVCGHDHTTHRGEDVTLCLDCSCYEHIPRCQNCGGESVWGLYDRKWDVCSLRCAYQLEHAEARKAAA
jgi:hypothetical protein